MICTCQSSRRSVRLVLQGDKGTAGQRPKRRPLTRQITAPSKQWGFPKLSTNTHSGPQASSRRSQWLTRRQPNTGPESCSEIVVVKDTREARQQLAQRGLGQGHYRAGVARPLRGTVNILPGLYQQAR
jgi:hypothetical protein